MAEEWVDRFLSLCELLGEVPTEVLVQRARMLFPGLVDDAGQRAAFREQMRFVAKARRSGALTTPEEVEELNSLARARFTIHVDGEPAGVHEPMPERTVEDVLSEGAVELKAAKAAEALAAAFEEGA